MIDEYVGPRFIAMEASSILRTPASVTDRQMPWNAMHDLMGGTGVFCLWLTLRSLICIRHDQSLEWKK